MLTILPPLHLLFLATVFTSSACFPDPALLDDEPDGIVVVADTQSSAEVNPGAETSIAECSSADDCKHLASNCLKVICLANTCATQPDPGATCDDGNLCTENDTCVGTTCTGAAYTCDDGVVCTEDRCDGDGGCTYPVADAFCRIDGLCVAGGTTKVDDPCRICRGGEAWSPNDGASCEDGEAVCTVNDTCDGTTCVGGPRPSDAATDWAFRPVDVVAPGTAAVVGLGPAAVDDIFVVSEVRGQATLPAAPPVPLSGESVVVVRRTRQGQTIPTITYTGFEKASLRVFRRPTQEPWVYLLVVRRTGIGVRQHFGQTATVGEVGVEVVEFLRFDRFGSRVLLTEWSASVDNGVVLSDGTIIVTGKFSGPFAPPDAPAFAWDGGRPDAPWHRYVAWISPQGAPQKVFFIESASFLGGADLLAAPDTNEVWVSLSFNGSVHLVDGTGRTREVLAPHSWWHHVVVHTADRGENLTTREPFVFSSSPSDPNIGFGAPQFAGVMDGGPVVVVSGEPTSDSAVGLTTLENGITSQSVIAFDSAWNRRWAITARRAGFSPAGMAGGVWVDGQVVTGVWQGQLGETVLVAGFHEVPFPDDGLGIFVAGVDGSVSTTFGLGDGAALLTGVLRLPDSTIAVALNVLYRDMSVDGADSSQLLEATSDVTGYVLGLNSNLGLQCSMP